MITEQDLQAAIAECQGKRNPDASTCIKLAAFYTIKSHLYPEAPEKLGHGTQDGYSYAAGFDSGTEFSDAIRGKGYDEIMPVMDELMETLRVVNPRLYAGVMRKL